MRKICIAPVVCALILCLMAVHTGCAGKSSSDTAPDPHAGLVQYGDEWITPEEMEALREVEWTDLGWNFEYKIATAHYMIYSSATLEQTRHIGTVAEALYLAYFNFFSPSFSLATGHPRLKVKLFKDRDEFRDIALGGMPSWAEGYYDGQYCNLYYDAAAPNPYHWFLHEATHQLNYEVAGFSVPQWIDEGLACYFGTSRFADGTITPGDYDANSYPVWWLPSYQGGGVIHLRNIIDGGGPDFNTYFNLYYLEWWSLSHFLFHYDSGRYKQGYFDMIKGSGTLAEFEQLIGDIDTVHAEWYSYFNSL